MTQQQRIPEQELISEPRVMYTAAGHFIGYEYWDVEEGCWLPWSRQTEYDTACGALNMLGSFAITDAETDVETKAIWDYHQPGLADFVITAISRGYCDE